MPFQAPNVFDFGVYGMDGRKEQDSGLIGMNLKKKICLLTVQCPISMLLSIRRYDGKGLDANLGVALNALNAHHQLARPACP